MLMLINGRPRIISSSVLALVFGLMALVSCGPSQVSSLQARTSSTRTVYVGPHLRDYDVFFEFTAGDLIVLIGQYV